MTITRISINKTLQEVEDLLQQEEQLSSALRAAIQLLLTMVKIMAERFSLNSRNSSKPPAADPHREKKPPTPSARSPGGQIGRLGTQLAMTEYPDVIIPILCDMQGLPEDTYREAGVERRQVVEIEIQRKIIEYRAQVLKNTAGKKFVASFPQGVTRPIQYGHSIKSHSVYLSQYQLIPYERVADYFNNQAKIPISVGSLCNFNQEAYELLEAFALHVKNKLRDASLLHVDETGINVNGKRVWLHCAVNERWSYFHPDEKRGTLATDAMGILPAFKGIMVHDHWKPYYTYKHCKHSLCNAHHVRELKWVTENHPEYTWAALLKVLLYTLHDAVNKTEERCLSPEEALVYRTRYREIIAIGEQEMPEYQEAEGAKKQGRRKKSKARNLWERLRTYEEDTLRFMEISYVPFTNNPGEQALRMTKVQQKISGSFRSMEGAKIFCRIRSYLLTAQKHKLNLSEALTELFQGRMPEVFFAEDIP